MEKKMTVAYLKSKLSRLVDQFQNGELSPAFFTVESVRIQRSLNAAMVGE